MVAEMDEVAREFGLAVTGAAVAAVHEPAQLAEARPGAFTWVKAFDERTMAALGRLRGVTVVVPPARTPAEAAALDAASRENSLSVAENPRLAFARMLGRLFPHLELAVPAGIDPSARVDPTARIGRDVTIGAFCFVGQDVEVGDGTVLQPGVVVHSRTVIGRNCIIGSHAVLGQRGFGFVRAEDGSLVHFPQVGRVVLEDDVEVKSCTVVDRPGLGETRILRGSKVDNLCQVGHGARVGPHAVVAACAELGASVVLGEGAWMGPDACSIENVSIGKGAFVGVGAVVLRDVPDGAVVAGSPAEPIDVLTRARRAVRKLVESEG